MKTRGRNTQYPTSERQRPRGFGIGSKRGLTLTELMIVIALTGLTSLMIASQMSGVQSYFASFFKTSNVEDAILNISDDLTVYFLRGRSVTFAHIDSALYGTANQATQKGFLIFGNGLVTIKSDMRPCNPPKPANAFNPSTSDSNLTTISLLCCGQGSTTGFSASACKDGPGLSITVTAPNGRVLNQTCLKDFTQMNVAAVGKHNAYNSTLYYFDFLSKAGTASGGAASVAGSERRAESFQALANTGYSPVTFCQQTVPKANP